MSHVAQDETFNGGTKTPGAGCNVHSTRSEREEIPELVQSVPVYCDCDKLIEANSAVAKSLRDSPADTDQLVRLYNEYNVLTSGRFSKCASVRAALKKNESKDALHTFYLEWIDGVTLTEWIRSTHQQYRERDVAANTAQRKDFFLKLVHLAYAIVRNFSGLHNIKARNIIVIDRNDANHVIKRGSKESLIKIIDLPLGKSVGDSCDVTDPLDVASLGIKDDLESIGKMLYEMFSGDILSSCKNEGGITNTGNSNGSFPPEALGRLSIHDDVTASSQKRREKSSASANKPHMQLREAGAPVSLCELISNLMHTVENEENSGLRNQYDCLVEVEQDLERMVTAPNIFLWDPFETLSGIGQLEFPGDKLYGREEHIAKLIEIYYRTINQSNGCFCEMVLISGYSGAGKSALVQSVRGRLVQSGGQFISGKFDRLQQAKPLSIVSGALDEYCDDLVGSDPSLLDELTIKLTDAVGSCGSVLTDLIPSLHKIIGKSHGPSENAGSVESQNQLMFFLLVFLRAISSPSHPVIFFLDDLQWADPIALDFIRLLVSDANNTSLLFLGCYRDNEVKRNHPLAVLLDEINRTEVNITDIKVDAIDKGSVNALVSETLHLLPRSTKPLANAVHHKTGGNALFVVQFLKSLHEEGFLRFSMKLWRWEWDIEQVESKIICGDVALLMKNKMLRLSKEVQFALKIAASLGSTCEESTLKLLDNINEKENIDIAHFLHVAVEEGLVDKVGSRYKFAHDQIQLAAYSLVPENERVSLHLQIGRLIWKKSLEVGFDRLLFVVADQLNRGSSLIIDHHERIDVAQLDLRAGETSMSCSDFSVALTYLNAGVALLDNEKDWERHYLLSLKLFSCAAESAYVMGDFDGMTQVLGPVFIHARCFEDKLSAYRTLVRALGAQEKYSEAISTALNVLEQLGEPFPDSPDESTILKEMTKTNLLLEGVTDAYLAKARVMMDQNKLVAMQFLDRLILYAFIGKQEYLPLVVSRMVQLSLTHGVCKDSASGFAAFGLVLCGPNGDLKRGCSFGKLALFLLERFDAKECMAKVYAFIYGTLNSWVQPLQLSLEKNFDGYHIGMMTGDLEFAMANYGLYFGSAVLNCGTKLQPLLEQMKVHSYELASYKLDLTGTSFRVFWQTALNLVGRSEDPLRLTGEAMNQDDMANSTNTNAVCFTHLYAMWLAYLFQSYDLAAELAEKSRNVGTILTGKFEVCQHTFFDGLIALSLARLTRLKKWINIADKAIEKMKFWAEFIPWNCQHKLDLLDAEYAFFVGNLDKASKMYDKAIDNAGRHKFIHDRAMACERAGIFYMEKGSPVSATAYFSLAHKLYLEWGAQAKADHVQDALTTCEMFEST